MRKINLENYVLKKISFLIAGVFILSLFLIPKFSIKAADNISIDVIPIKILEIEPGDLFKLTNVDNAYSIEPNKLFSNNNNTIPKSESFEKVLNNKKLNITVDHVTMPEFISKINDIEGEYDVIVIGRYNAESNLVKDNWMKYELPSDKTVWPGTQYKYIDYNNPFSSSISTRVFGNDYSEKEYYSENDITKKRMKQIEESINNSKLIYLDTNIGITDINNNGTDKTIKDTNLFRLYNLYDSNKINLKKISTNDIQIEKIVNDYLNLSEDYKRPNIYNIVSPSGDNDNPYNPENSINLGFTSLNNKVENLTVKVYIDINGDGLFDDNELKKTDKLKCNVGENTYKTQYNIESTYNGYFGWKIIIQKDSGTKTSITGNCIVGKKLDNDKKKSIRLLHIDSSFGDDGDMSKWDFINPYVAQDSSVSPKLRNLMNGINYNLSVETFNATYIGNNLNLLGHYDENEKKYIYNYDGILISGVWGNFNVDGKIIDILKRYVKDGKKLILSQSIMSIDNNSINNFTKEFRDSVGLSRYKDPYNLESQEDDSVHDDTTQLGENIYSAGISASYALGENIPGGEVVATAINKNAMNSYPFKLNKLTIKDNNASPINFQLNLEDEKVIPLYTFEANYGANNDARNYSYAFIKGNIAFMSSFRNNNNGADYISEDQFKLLINLLVNDTNSIKKSNNNPTILSNQLADKSLSNISYSNYKYNLSGYESNLIQMNENSVIELNSIENGFNFITTVSDPDDDKVKITNIKINDTDIDSNMIDNGKDLVNDYKESGSQIGVYISKDYLENIKNTQSKEITIEISVEDENGGESTAAYIIKLKNIMTIDHGLYKGLNSNPVIEDIGESNTKTFASGSLVTLGVLLDNIETNNVIEIKFDDKLTDNNIIQIQAYYVNSNNTLELISNNSNVTNNKYILSSLDTSARKILIIYNEQLPTNINKDNDKYINKILVDNEDVNKPAIIRINGQLPDLF